MAQTRAQRRLAAIVVADVVGNSRMMESDETGTLAALKERRETILQPVVRAHGGRLVKIMGDGVLIGSPAPSTLWTVSRGQPNRKLLSAGAAIVDPLVPANLNQA